MTNEPMQDKSDVKSIADIEALEADEALEEDEEIDEIGEYVGIGGAGMNQPQEEGKNPYNNPKNHIITVVLLVMMVLILIFTDYMKKAYEKADSEVYFDVIVQELKSGPQYAEERLYYSVSVNGETRQIEEFSGDGAERFITAHYEHEQGRINYLTDRSIYRDDNADDQPDGEAVEMSAEIERILELIEQTETEHWIMQARILCADGECFVCVDRNVNLWTPYVLYYYSVEHDALYELVTFDDMDVVDVRLGEDFKIKADELMNIR